ncbi:MAG: leucyl aminopeptidase family protein, partial [Deferribacterales bacterium]
MCLPVEILNFKSENRYNNYIVPVIKKGDELCTYLKNREILTVLRLLDNVKTKNYEVCKVTTLKKDKLHNYFFLVMPDEKYDFFRVAELGRKFSEEIKKLSCGDAEFVYYEIEKFYSIKNDFSLTKKFIEGLYFGLYSFNKYKKSDENTVSAKLILHDKIYNYFNECRFINEANILFKNIFLVRDLINTPPNELTPENFVKFIKENLAPKIELTVLNHEEIKKNGLNLIDAVGSGSQHKPFLVKLSYIGNPDKDKKIALVGKGVTFDSGGTNLKPTGSIETMKSDMSGAAIVFGVINTLAELTSDVNLVVFIPLVENTIGATAYRPGDIIKSYSGKTVEILNTDAEGRLILADALAMAVKENPSLIIDVATLTGACVVALGSFIAGYFTNNEQYAVKMEKAFKENYEDIWRLPLYDRYKDRLKSKVADLQNISKKRTEAGAIMGALFLQEFIEDYPWIHIDIAGPAFMEDKHP